MLSAVVDAARRSSLDLSRLRVVCDWLQYRQNFREPVMIREIQPSALQSREAKAYEIAIDLRRAGSSELAPMLSRSFGPDASGGAGCRQYLEDWRRESESCIWAFNGLYWNALRLWEQSTGRDYEQALPGGETDARNTAAARELILQLFHVWDNLAARHALPEDLHILELGVGNGNQARVWLDEFVRLDREHRGEYYRRLHYLMGDYSPHVLARARENVGDHAQHVSSLVLDARLPSETLGFLRSKAFLIYISNVYDNLPTDEIARIGGHLYQVEVRAYLPEAEALKVAEALGAQPESLPELVARLLQIGPELLSKAAPELFAEGGTERAVEFWRDVWEALRLEERYVPIEGLDTYQIAPEISGELLRPLAEANGDIRMHVSNGAAASFADSLPLLHPFGVLQCHDLFVTDVHRYTTSFCGPGKYDGSIVNWVNGPLLAALGRRHGYDVTFQPFAHRSGSNISTLSARIRE